MATIYATLCHITSDGKVLLLKKSKGLFGEGRWNGPGGKLSEQESIRDCAIREIREETGLDVATIHQYGALKFYFGQKKQVDWIVYVFLVDSFGGSIRSSSEGEIRWFNLNEVPYCEMWEDDKFWLPLLIAKRRFRGVFHFDQHGTRLLGYRLCEF